MDVNRLEQQMRFLVEVDKMKSVYRRTILIDKTRRESDAEHSWHFALMAMLLAEYADPEKVDCARVIRMALVHDLIEIYAGDTFAYDVQGNQDKRQRETEAADKLFALLPEDQAAEIRALWEEFDAMETPDAQYADGPHPCGAPGGLAVCRQDDSGEHRKRLFGRVVVHPFLEF